MADGSVIIDINGDSSGFKKELDGVRADANDVATSMLKTVAAVGAAIGGLAMAAANVGAEFETSFAKVETIMDTSQMSVGDMKTAIVDMSKEMGVSASTLSETVYNAISATGDTAHAVELVGTASKLAAAGFTDTDSALGVLTTTINAYGLEASDAEAISDSLIQTQNLGVTTIDKLAGSMGKAIASASAYGIDLYNLESAYISLTKAGISTEESTTYLSSMFKELGDTGSDVGKIIKEKTGKSFSDLMREGKSLGDVMQILVDHCGGSSDALMNLWSSAEAGKASNAIVNQGLENFNTNLDKVKNSAGTTAKAYGTMSETFEHKTEMIKTGIENLAISLYERMKPALANVADAVLDFIKNFDFDAAINAVEVFIGVLAGVGAAAVGLKALFAIQDIMAFVGAIKAAEGGVISYTATTKLGTAATKIFNTVAAASPWGLLAIGIGAVITGLTVYATLSGEGKTATDELNDRVGALRDSTNELADAQSAAAETRSKSLASVEHEISTVQKDIDELRNLTDANGHVKEGYEERAAQLSELINSVVPGAVSASSDEAGAYYKISDSVEDLIFKKKKEMALEAMREEYTAALKGQYEANKQLSEAIDARTKAYSALKTAQDNADDPRYRSQIHELSEAYDEACKVVDDLTESSKEYQKTISAFDAVSAASSIQELESAMRGLSDEFVQFNGTNVAEVEAATGKSIAAYQTLVAKAASHWGEMSDADRQQWAGLIENARAAMEEQIAQCNEAGSKIPAELAAGAEMNADMLPEGVRRIVEQAKKEAEARGESFADVGEVLAYMMSNGLEANSDEPVNAAKDVTSDAVSAADAEAKNAKKPGETFSSSEASGISSGEPKIKTAADMITKSGVNSADTAAKGAKKPGETFGASETDAIKNASGQLQNAAATVTKAAVDKGTSVASGGGVVGTTLGNAVATSITGSNGVVIGSVSALINSATSAGTNAARSASTSGNTFVSSFSAGVNSSTGNARVAATNMATSAVSAGRNATSGASGIGAAIASGTASGISSGLSSVINAAASLARRAIAAAKSALGIHSPSREFAKLGRFTSEGLAEGIKASAKKPIQAVKDLTDNVLASAKALNTPDLLETPVTIDIDTARERIKDAVSTIRPMLKSALMLGALSVSNSLAERNAAIPVSKNSAYSIGIQVYVNGQADRQNAKAIGQDIGSETAREMRRRGLVPV